MKNSLLLFCLISVYGLMSCSEKKSVEEKTTEQTAPPSAEVLDEGVVIGKQLQEDTLKGSLKAYAKGKAGDAEIKITYHSPAVRSRIVWGGLVPFDKVWVTGAHMATTFEINKDFEVDGKNIPAGKYAIFTIPGKEIWTFILNKNWQQHLTDEYDTKDDVVRVVVKPETEEPHQERLRYSIEEEGDSESEIVMYWEKIELTLSIKVK
jgi:Protein of unknown function (DUF2911)